MLWNDKYLVVPVVALVEGVLNNIYYSKEIIKSFAETWAGTPITVNHPMSGDMPESANSPHYENTVIIGKFYNVRIEEDKLKGDCYINIAKAISLGFENLITHFRNGKKLEVSTGLIGTTTESSGTFNGKDYSQVMQDIRPDHLALLTKDTGACSIEDGCGVFNVKEGASKAVEFIKKLMQQNKQEKIDLNGLLITNSEGGKMTKKALIAALIANAANKYKDEDMDFLNGFDEKTLQKMMPVENKEKDKKDDDKKEAKPGNEAEPVANALSDEDMVLFNQLKDRERERVDAIKSAVVKAHKSITTEIANNMGLEALNALALDIKKTPDYSGAGGTGITPNKTTERTHKPIILANKEDDDGKKDEKDNKGES